MGDEPQSAILESTDGWTRVVLTDAQFPAALSAAVLVVTRFWERDVDIRDANLVPDATARVEGITLDSSAVSRLADDIDAWVSLPLSELAATAFRGDYPLAGGVGQTLTLQFDAGRRPGSVAVAVDVGQERLTCRVGFEADVTGCAALVTGLRAILDSRET